MRKRTEYYLQADFCKDMAAKSASVQGRERWLDLAAKWLTLAEETYGQNLVDLVTMQVRSRSEG